MQTRTLINYLRKKIENTLQNTFDDDKNNIKSIVENIIKNDPSKEFITNYEVVCDDSNNFPNDNFIKMDIYLKPINNTSHIVHNIIIDPDLNKIRIEKLRKEKIEKLNKLNVDLKFLK